MSLFSLPDVFDDNTHKELDALVQRDIGPLSSMPHHDLCSNTTYLGLVLTVIVKNSKNKLNKAYGHISDAEELLNFFGVLGGMLASAVKNASYREVRNLAILRARTSLAELQAGRSKNIEDSLFYKNLSRVFQDAYHGAAVDGFREYLKYNDKLFEATVDTPEDEDHYYVKICSVVQSSGTGKTRMLTELSKKDVIVIYMNLREEGDTLGFPVRDNIPSKILTKFPCTANEYQIVCSAFFVALFRTVSEYLSGTRTSVFRWAHEMCNLNIAGSIVRADFFCELNEQYTKVHNELSQLISKNKRTADKISDNKNIWPSLTEPVEVACRDMVVRLKNYFSEDSGDVKFVIAIDEAHTLIQQGNGKGLYRPADIFCKVVNGYSRQVHYGIWVVFASTVPGVADFLPQNQNYGFSHVSVLGQRLFQPYTELGWDQNAPKLEEIALEAIPRAYIIAGYGRPLWLSLKATGQSLYDVLETTKSKLCGGGGFNPNNQNQVLAVLGQRFALEVSFGHPKAAQQRERGIASHLLICLGMTPDRNWRFASYPSEPFLSCAAAITLHRPKALKPALENLVSSVNLGTIEVGKHGGLASRLLWLLGKDVFVRSQTKYNDVITKLNLKWGDHLPDCCMIPVVAWLEFMFGSKVWGNYMEGDERESDPRQVFMDAYVNFSHWVCMDTNIAGVEDGDELPLDEWTKRHWYRTSGVQCAQNQPLIDKVIPIYFRAKKTYGSGMSQIFILDKAGKYSASKEELYTITRRHKNIGGETIDPNLPYIAILVYLGEPPSFSTDFSEEMDSSHKEQERCLRIYASGIDTITFPFLDKHPELMACLRHLVKIQQTQETELSTMESLRRQFMFANGPTDSYMNWEEWKDE